MTIPALRLSPRQSRVLDALTTTAGWIAREALDRIAGASNSPDVVMRLRRKLGDDAIDMRQVDALDRDNRPCRPGQYRLTEQGRQRLAQMGGASC
ncbi:winged helix-turn-helix domain-containing protein [Oryzisolibacter propanilivorax]|nr:winged helix-turn-helix domain-containing protein [Oryzisolibacter propanilivorax]